MTDEQIKIIDLFLCKVNRVTCPFRHTNKVPEKELVLLSNAQIDFEKWLSEQ